VNTLFHRSICLAVALCAMCCSLTAFGQDAKAAKDFYDKAQSAGGNQCLQMTYVCKAASLDSKKKEYKQACDATRASLAASDRESLKKAHDAFDSGAAGYNQATRYSKYVCEANTELYAEAQSIIKDVQKAQAPPPAVVAAKPAEQPPTPVTPKQDPSASFLKQAKDSFDAGDFNGARSAAGQVTDPAMKSQTNDILASISRYQADLMAAKQHETNGDIDGAIKGYQAALGINSHVPDNTASHIQELQNKLHPANNPVVAGAGQAPSAGKNQPPKPPVEDPNVTAAKLMDEATKAQAAGKLQDALKAYEAVLRIQPSNGLAMSGRGAVQAIISSDPAEQAKTLAQALRDFYATKYSDAEDELSSYLSSTNVKSRGVAHFYLAAARLSRSLMDKPVTPQSVQTAQHNPEILKLFKQSSSEQYKPVERYVSPIIMDAWRSASAGN
jgi:tetratricopeptide (TPR) repeat protein